MELKDFEIGDCFQYYSNVIVMYLGKDEEIEDIHYIAIMFNTPLLEDRRQLSFAPIHTDFVKELEQVEYVAKGIPDKATQKESLELWAAYNDNVKTYFTVPINTIIQYFLPMVNQLGVKYAPMFPTMKKPE